MPENLTTALRFSIIGCTEENIELIKTALGEIPLALLLIQTYCPPRIFNPADLLTHSVDFIVTDQASFTEMEEKQINITLPIIVFTDRSTELKPVHNIIFDTIHLPFNLKKIEKIVKKIGILKVKTLSIIFTKKSMATVPGLFL